LNAEQAYKPYKVTRWRGKQQATMATEETVQLNPAHEPLQASIDAFDSILESLKDELVKLRRDHDSASAIY
jgi:hypothetical protein